MSLENKINNYVEAILEGYIPSKSGEKIIHDPIWGSVLYYGWEIDLIDSPLLQRLRDIHQLGMADLTYTAARHSRFEHSLGTAAIAGRMMEKLSHGNGYKITSDDINSVRLAAILHDVGHCFFSHLSERVYGEMPSLRSLMTEKAVSASPHEFLSYLIITSKSFADFFEKYIEYPEKDDTSALLQRVANMVVGKVNRNKNGEKVSFMTSIINGEFDADKLDYTQRDSYTAGIAMTYGVERFLMKLIIYKDERHETDYVLAVDSDALTTVEELIFNRNILYVYMYRHQKVLATEAALHDVVLGMKDIGLLNDPSDFLQYTDSDIENFDTFDKIPFESSDNFQTLGQMIKKVKSRRLPKRTAEFSLEKMAQSSEKSDFERVKDFILKVNSNIEKLRFEIYEQIREEYYKLGKIVDFTVFDIYISFPPPIKTSTNFLLVSKDKKIRLTSEIKYIKEWAEAFAAEKWRGYVFCSVNIDKEIAIKATKTVIKYEE